MITEKARPVELEEAIRLINAQIEPITESGMCCVDDACGRIIAEDVIASFDHPPFPRSPFDGYALRSADTAGAGRESPVTLSVIGEVDAGGWFSGVVSAGEAVRIMTGAPIPEGTDAVIKQEETDYGEDLVRIYRTMKYHQNYIPAGEDYHKGDILLEKGEYIGPIEAGIIASAGLTEVSVFRRPRAIVISTGDELNYPGEDLKPGKIYDSNMYTIRAQLEAWGAEVAACFHMGDEAGKDAGSLRKWADKVDFIVTSGGVSVGKKDIMHEVFSILGIERILWKVGIKPGSAFLAGKYGKVMESTGMPCYISAAFYEQSVPKGWTLVKDEITGSNGGYIGPMGGIYSCLMQAKRDGLGGLFFAPCDAPLYKREIIDKLKGSIDDKNDSVCWKTSDDRIQTTFGWYSVRMIPVLKEEIDRGCYKLMKSIEKSAHRIVDAKDFDVDEKGFVNVNTENDYLNTCESGIRSIYVDRS